MHLEISAIDGDTRVACRHGAAEKCGREVQCGLRDHVEGGNILGRKFYGDGCEIVIELRFGGCGEDRGGPPRVCRVPGGPPPASAPGPRRAREPSLPPTGRDFHPRTVAPPA